MGKEHGFGSAQSWLWKPAAGLPGGHIQLGVWGQLMVVSCKTAGEPPALGTGGCGLGGMNSEEARS